MTNQASQQRLENRIEELETKYTFQEDSIEALNQVLICQQKDINKLMQVIENINSQVERLNDGQGAQAQDERPPHY